MKFNDISLGQKVWFGKPLCPSEYVVRGVEDKGQNKFVTLVPTNSSASNNRLRIEGSSDRSNGWGWDADFAFSNSRDEWYDDAMAELTRRKSLKGDDNGSRFPLGKNRVITEK